MGRTLPFFSTDSNFLQLSCAVIKKQKCEINIGSYL